MAQRFYFPRIDSAGHLTPSITPAFYSSWNRTSEARRVQATAIKSGATDGTPLIDSFGTGSNPNDVLILQAIIGPFAPQTISTNWKGVIATRETDNLTNACSQFCLRAVDITGTNFISTLIDFDTSAHSNEWVNGTVTARRFPKGYANGGVGISGTINKPFYLVAEYGARVSSTDTTNLVRLNQIRDESSSTDMTETEGGSASGTISSWCELTSDLVLYTRSLKGVIGNGIVPIRR